MIGQLRGKLIDKRPNQVLLDVGGVGYQLQVPLSTFAGLGHLHADATLLVHTHLREDQLALYGFLTAREKQCFEMLISASGVGPSLALKILSGLAIDELVPAIRKGDLAQLVRIPGVGRKTAERIVVELREKMALVETLGPAGEMAPRSQTEADVSSALVNLGYETRAVQQALERVRGGENEGRFDLLLRAALQQLGAAAMQKGARAGKSG